MTLDTSRFGKAFLALLLVAAQAAGLLALVGTKPAAATFPGANGKIVFASTRTTGVGVNNPEGDSEIFAMNPDGRGIEQITVNDAHDADPAWSAQGNAIAFVSQRDNQNLEIYVMDADGTDQTRLTSNTATDVNPTFSPNGNRIAFTSDRASFATDDIWVMDAKDEITNLTGEPGPDGNGDQLQRLTTVREYDSKPAWSPDGSKIAFESTRDDPFGEIYTMDPVPESATNQPVRLTTDAASDFSPNWSPDGSKIAFTRTQNENKDIYVMNANGSEQKRLTKKAAFDSFPAWSPDGTRIAFRSDRGGGDTEVYVMKARPEGRRNRPKNLTRNEFEDTDPDWLPAA